MSSNKKKTPAEELLESLLNDVNSSDENLDNILELKPDDDETPLDDDVLGTQIHEPDPDDTIQGLVDLGHEENNEKLDFNFETVIAGSAQKTEIKTSAIQNEPARVQTSEPTPPPPVETRVQPSLFAQDDAATQALKSEQAFEEPPALVRNETTTLAVNRTLTKPSPAAGDSEKTLAVTAFQIRPEENLDDKIKVSVGKQSRSTGFASWGGGAESNLGQAENLRMAQEKILELENENEKLRRQNEELIAAAEIIKERSDLLTAQLTEFRNDRDGLELSFKNEMTLLKNHLNRKESESQRAQFKIDELESRLKFDMKKIRVRERELENRLELVRAEKNAIAKNKDEQILDLRRKMDVMQMEVDSYRQKCVELNRQIESSQDSFKRTTRALRLAMANLELQEENKVPLKKAE